MEAWAEKRAQDLQATFRNALSGSAELHSKLKKAYLAYQNMRENDVQTKSKGRIPLIYNAVRHVHARVIGALESVVEPIRVLPNGFVTPIEQQTAGEMEFRAALLQSLANLNYKMSDAASAISEAVQDCLICGWGVIKTGFRSVETLGEFTMESTEQYAEMVRVSPFCFFVDPKARDVQSARWTFESIDVSRELVREQVFRGRWVPDAEKRISWTLSASLGGATTGRDRLRAMRAGTWSASDETADYATVVEAWTWEDPEGDGTQRLWVFWFDATSGNLLGACENPFKHGKRPYVVGVHSRLPDQIYGMGMAEILFPLWEKASTTLSQIEENVAAQNIRHVIDRSANVDREAFENSIPNGVIEMDNINGWKPFQASPMPADVWNIMSFYDGKIQEVSQVTPIVMGMRAATTAYATSVLQGQSDAAFDIAISTLRSTLLTPAFRQVVKNLQQFFSLMALSPVRLGGVVANGPVSAEDIQGDFLVEAADLKSEAAQRAQAQQMGAFLNQMLQLRLPANYAWLFVEIYRRLGLPDAHNAFEGSLFVPGGQIGQEGAGAADGVLPPATMQGQNAPAEEGGATEVAPPEAGGGDVRVAAKRNVVGALPEDIQGLLTATEGENG